MCENHAFNTWVFGGDTYQAITIEETFKVSIIGCSKVLRWGRNIKETSKEAGI